MIRQAIALLIVACVVGTLANLVSPNGIDFIGKYRDLSSGDGPIVPPSAEEGDPPFIDINVAQLEYNAGTSIFIDARDQSEFECGTIPGSINIPFDYLPETDDDEMLKVYIDSALDGAAKDKPLLIFCSGEECDVSLHMGRLLQDFEYARITIFFGGAREWEKAGLEVERREVCDE